jgi:hypothetical protein
VGPPHRRKDAPAPAQGSPKSVALPDWLTTTVLLVDPTSFPDHCQRGRDLRPTYRTLIRILQNAGAPFILIGNSRAERLAEPFHVIDPIPNIWIRDWGPVVGTHAVHAFRYAPDYAQGAYCPQKVRHAQQAVADIIGKSLRRIDLALDGGNLVHNGRVAIVTKKVFRENPALSHARIAERIRSLGFQRVLFIPNEPGDVVGHADGMLRFLHSDTLFVNKYTAVAGLAAFGRRLEAFLGTMLPETRILRYPYKTSGRIGCDGLPSAVGCAINALRSRKIVVAPYFRRRISRRDAPRSPSPPWSDEYLLPLGPRRWKDFNNAFIAHTMAFLECSRLARYGGALNCISLTF